MVDPRLRSEAGACVSWVKNEKNKKDHGVSFEEASELFISGVRYAEFFDSYHSDHEERLIMVGPIKRGMILVVCTEREGDTLHIISARWADRREKAQYRAYMDEET